MAVIGDPVASGIVASIARPGGNITGQSFFNAELRAKRIEFLKELMPRLTQVAVILNIDNPATVSEFQAMEATAQSLNIKLLPFQLRGPSELVSAVERMEQAGSPALASAMTCWNSMATPGVSTALGNPTNTPSPISFASRSP